MMGQSHLGQLNSSQLQVLAALADSESFSKAALRLQLSPSAVSYTISVLEKELGVELFSHSPHGTVPTPVGQKIIEHARHILQLIEDIYQQANLAKGPESEELRQSARLIIDLPPDLAQVLTRQAEQSDIPLPTLILQVLRQIPQKPSIPQWSNTILSYQEIPEFPAFESYRDELLPPSEAELF